MALTYFKKNGSWVEVSPENPMPVTGTTGGGSTDPASARDVSVLATNTALASILAELGQKLEPNDLTALARNDKLEQVRALLDLIKTALTGTLIVNTNLTGLATDTKLEAARALLGDLKGLLSGTLAVNTGLTGLALDTSITALGNALTAALAERTWGPPDGVSSFVTGAGTAVPLPANTKRAELFATGADARFRFGASTVTASANVVADGTASRPLLRGMGHRLMTGAATHYAVLSSGEYSFAWWLT